MTNDTMSAAVRDYVMQVRTALADLPAEDVEEFTTGMEADLAERLAEPGEGTLGDRLGTPEVYAAELRSAAGLPQRVAIVPTRVSAGERISAGWSRLSGQVLAAAPWLSDLRPLWWAVRGFTLAAVPMWIMGGPTVFYGMIGSILSVVLGLLVGQGVLRGGWIASVRVIGNVAAVLLLPIAFVVLVDRAPISSDVYGANPQASYGPGAGLTNDGEQVGNLYAYDETGRRIDKVRLLDQNGRAVKLSEDFVYQSGDQDALDTLRDPRTGELAVARDVFPLRWNDRTGWERFGDSEWEPPLAITPLPGPVPEVSAGPEPTVTPTPTGSPSPTASPQATQTSPGTGATATPTPATSASPSASR